MIIGLTGSMGAGKGEVVKILERLGFKYITLSQMVREEARHRGIPEEREKLMEVGNSMRKKHGPGVLAKLALQKIQAHAHDKWVIDGIRNPAEIEELKKDENAHIWGIIADQDFLISRILRRARPSDPKTHQEVLDRIQREWGKGEPQDGQQMERCMRHTDSLIENEGSLQELDKKVMELYNSLQS
ncbi:MAG: AAA family ATPase [Candidatus Peregrinibacteria bacterium]